MDKESKNSLLFFSISTCILDNYKEKNGAT